LPKSIVVEVVEADAFDFQADVLVLKYAQARYGVDAAVSVELEGKGIPANELTPAVGGFRLHTSDGAVAAQHVLLLGVVVLTEFEYREIRDFSRRALTVLAGALPSAKHLALTLHGAGYGLDELESFDAEVAGLVDAVRSSDCPPSLTRVSIVERNPGRAARLSERLTALLPEGIVPDRPPDDVRAERLRTAGYVSDAKPHVFVAMPFQSSMEDLYHYGIQGALHTAGFLCERADLETFLGDVMDWVRKRIATASLLVADLTGANANVYLEVGYAWASGVPTVLVIADSADGLKFDVKGQRCLVYKNIKDLEEKLASEVRTLREMGAI